MRNWIGAEIPRCDRASIIWGIDTGGVSASGLRRHKSPLSATDRRLSHQCCNPYTSPKKASGAPLIYELRAMGIPVQEFTPTRGNDKISRLNSVSDIFASGRVWYPPTHWAEEVIEEVASFPSGDHDDYVDSTSMALHRFRQGGYIGTELDERDEPSWFRGKKKGYY